MNLSVCVITTPNNATRLERLSKSLPADCEAIVLETVPSVTGRDEVEEVNPGSSNLVRAYRWHYLGEFHFARARNVCLSFARREWVLSIDSDEVLNPMEHEIMRVQLETAPRSVGGFYVHVGGFVNNPDGSQGHSINRQVRLFRNDPCIYYEGRIHEMVVRSLERAGLAIAGSGLTVSHEGYNADADTLVGKCRRNLRLLCMEYLEDPSDKTLSYLHGTTALLRDYLNANPT